MLSAFRTCLLTLCLILSSVLIDETWHVDLERWGYKPPPKQYAKQYESLEPLPNGEYRYIDFDSQDNVIVGFAARDTKNEKGTNGAPELLEASSLKWHALTFDRAGILLSERTIITRAWHENAIYAGHQGTLLVRTANALSLISSDGKLLAQRSLPPNSNYWIYIMPSRKSLMLSSVRNGLLEILDSANLRTIEECGKSSDPHVSSASEHSTLSYAPSPSRNIYTKQVRVNVRCGPLDFAYEGKRNDPDIFGSTLLDDHTVVSAGFEKVVLHDRIVERWRDSFDRKHDSVDSYVRSDEKGQIFAVLVKTSAGGSRILDIDSHLTKLRIVVYRARDGKRLIEIPFPIFPSSVLDFAVSGDGKRLGIFADGDLRVLAIPAS